MKHTPKPSGYPIEMPVTQDGEWAVSTNPKAPKTDRVVGTQVSYSPPHIRWAGYGFVFVVVIMIAGLIYLEVKKDIQK